MTDNATPTYPSSYEAWEEFSKSMNTCGEETAFKAGFVCGRMGLIGTEQPSRTVQPATVRSADIEREINELSVKVASKMQRLRINWPKDFWSIIAVSLNKVYQWGLHDASRPDEQAIRDQALEDATEVAEDCVCIADCGHYSCAESKANAKAIRRLKGKPSEAQPNHRELITQLRDALATCHSAFDHFEERKQISHKAIAAANAWLEQTR